MVDGAGETQSGEPGVSLFFGLVFFFGVSYLCQGGCPN